jgi:cytochrome b subunit of formate dehydrogenase
MAVFMVIVMLSGQQTECCSGSLRRYLYRELLGGRGERNIHHFLVVVVFFFFLGIARVSY